MEKITYEEMCRRFIEYNEYKGYSKNPPLRGVVVYKQSNWTKPYSETERSYEVRSDCRAFESGKIANSVFGNCLDGTDIGVRLDWYNWEVDYCYMLG